MTALTASETPIARRRIGLPNGRAVVGGLLMALAALITVIAYSSATSVGPGTTIMVADRDLVAGDVIAAADLRSVSVDGTVAISSFRDGDLIVGRTVLAPVGAGEAIGPSLLAEQHAVEGFEVWLELASVRAAGGRLQPGDTVEVFSTWRDVTELIAVNATVIDVSTTEAILGSGSLVTVRLALTEFAEVQAAVHAQAAGDLTLVRSTAAVEATPARGHQYRPTEDPDA